MGKLTTHLEDGPEALLELVAELLAHLAEGILLHLVRVRVRCEGEGER